MTRHRIRVVAAGLLLVMASLTLLPVTSGAGMIKWRDPTIAPPGDPDFPTGRLVRVRFGSLRMLVLWMPETLKLHVVGLQGRDRQPSAVRKSQ